MDKASLLMAVVLTAFCLLTSAARAYAECALVLCGNISGPPDYEVSISPVSSSDTRQQCAQSLARQIMNIKRVFANSDAAVDKLRGAPKATAKTQAKDGSVPVSVFRYQCLPDTVDPYAAKGK